MNNHKRLKEELKLLYSDELIGDTELEQMTDNLVSFFTQAVEIMQQNNDNQSQKEIKQ